MYYGYCSVLSLWLSSTLHTLPYTPLCFWYTRPPDCSHQALHCWLPRLFCFRSIYMEWPSPSSLTETLSGLIQILPENISFPNCRPALFSVPCWRLHPFQVSLAFAAHFELHIFKFYMIRTLVCVGASVRVYAPRIVSRDKILFFKNTFVY